MTASRSAAAGWQAGRRTHQQLGERQREPALRDSHPAMTIADEAVLALARSRRHAVAATIAPSVRPRKKPSRGQGQRIMAQRVLRSRCRWMPIVSTGVRLIGSGWFSRTCPVIARITPRTRVMRLRGSAWPPLRPVGRDSELLDDELASTGAHDQAAVSIAAEHGPVTGLTWSPSLRPLPLQAWCPPGDCHGPCRDEQHFPTLADAIIGKSNKEQEEAAQEGVQCPRIGSLQGRAMALHNSIDSAKA